MIYAKTNSTNIIAAAVLALLSLFFTASIANAEYVYTDGDAITTQTVTITSGTAQQFDIQTILGITATGIAESKTDHTITLAISSIPTTDTPVLTFCFQDSGASLTATESLDETTYARTGTPVLEGTTILTSVRGRYLNIDSKEANGKVRITRVNANY